MDARSFIEIYGKDEATKVATVAGTNWDYFRQIASGHRRPSPDLAEKLVDASGGRLNFEKLLKRKTEAAA